MLESSLYFISSVIDSHMLVFLQQDIEAASHKEFTIRIIQKAEQRYIIIKHFNKSSTRC